jgi:hypothetical protein
MQTSPANKYQIRKNEVPKLLSKSTIKLLIKALERNNTIIATKKAQIVRQSRH